MKVIYSNIKSSGKVCGVEYATATAHFPTGQEMTVTDRLSKFNLFEHLRIFQLAYNIKEEDIDVLLLLMEEDNSQQPY